MEVPHFLILCSYVFFYFIISVSAQDECDGESMAQATILCPTNEFILMALGSRSPFFGDALSASCTNFRKQIYSEEKTTYVFFSIDGGLSLNAQCPRETDIITEFTLCIADSHVTAITIHCSSLIEPETVTEVYNATSDEYKHTLVSCGHSAAIQGIQLMDAGNGLVTRVVLKCISIPQETDDIPYDV
ncbi:uncharacterized protein NPIL_205411 [Nephila pilipes]|uniref:Uncharacterized protein n=1 Tax=Nephila pilipes TaxID=299642 RepID=A0A8X6I3P4_NEPPI|nr:uncharacterized protein NPIL_205411 [Nephila pilipes]